VKITTDTENGLSSLGKAGEEIVLVAIKAGVIGVTILAPGLFGIWLLDESPVVQVVVRIGAFVLLVGTAAFTGMLLTILCIGIPEYLGFRSYPALLRTGALLISATAVLWHGPLFGILVVISAASTLWRGWFWKRRVRDGKY